MRLHNGGKREIEGRKSAREHDSQSQPEPDLGETVYSIVNKYD